MEQRERVGVAILRVWAESGATPPIRARITTVDDVGGAEHVVDLSTADRTELFGWLDRWLDHWLEEA